MARDLHAAVEGAVIKAATVLRSDIVRGGSALSIEKALRGTRITAVFRRAKSVVIVAGLDARLVVAPRFTGSLLIDAEPDPYSCAVFELTDGRTLTYRDVRRLGTMTLFDRRSYAAWSETIGPEPLEPGFTVEVFTEIVRGSKRAVKVILMDQHRIAGVGNIYANEALWRAGVRPARAGSSLTRAACARLHASVVGVLRDAVDKRGTTFRDFRDAYGEGGGFSNNLAVYGRGGLPCRDCGSELSQSHALEGRQTVWCPKCQR
jgi:formamidopyrimidine-DNA glycosylase